MAKPPGLVPFQLSFPAALPRGSEKSKLPMLFLALGYVLPLCPPGDPFKWKVLLSLLHFPAAVYPRDLFYVLFPPNLRLGAIFQNSGQLHTLTLTHYWWGSSTKGTLSYLFLHPHLVQSQAQSRHSGNIC